MSNSKNKTVAFLYKHCVCDRNSVISRNIFYIGEYYDCRGYELCGMKNTIKKELTGDEKRQCEFTRELLLIRDGIIHVDGLSISNIQDIIDHVSTS